MLHDDLVTMETMVYECHIDNDLGFADIRETPKIDKLRLMMSRVSAGKNITVKCSDGKVRISSNVHTNLHIQTTQN